MRQLDFHPIRLSHPHPPLTAASAVQWKYLTDMTCLTTSGEKTFTRSTMHRNTQATPLRQVKKVPPQLIVESEEVTGSFQMWFVDQKLFGKYDKNYTWVLWIVLLIYLLCHRHPYLAYSMWPNTGKWFSSLPPLDPESLGPFCLEFRVWTWAWVSWSVCVDVGVLVSKFMHPPVVYPCALPT